jgi:predicted GNAT family acetyltransferase
MTADDRRTIAGLMRYLRGGTPHAPVTDEEARRIGLNPLRYVLVADGQVVSTAATNGVGISAFQILGVATHAEHRGKGYAAAVCAALIRAMRKEGARQTIIFTGRGNAPALRCYGKLGFRPTGEYWVAKVARTTEGK